MKKIVNELVTLVAYPRDLDFSWRRLNLETLMLDLMEIEKRVIRGSNVRSEHTRYNLVRDRLEYVVRYLLLEGSKDSSILTLNLGAEYLKILDMMLSEAPGECEEARIGRSVHPHYLVKKNVSAFTQVARKLGLSETETVRSVIKFFNKASSKRKNVVALFNPLGVYDEGIETEDIDDKKYNLDFLRLPASDEVTDTSGMSIVRVAKERVGNVVQGVTEGSEVALNLDGVRNDAITKSLRKYVYESLEEVQSPLMVPMIYSDGSRARDFPVGCLSPWDDKKLKKLRQRVPVSKVGMLTGRHGGMDSVVGMYWFRNQEISVERTQGETDEVCYNQSKQLFRKIREEGPWRIDFYQTGFPPALVGFLRALVEELMEINGKKPYGELVPVYFIKGKHIRGRPWN